MPGTSRSATKKVPFKAKFLGWLISVFIKAIGFTLRFDLDDRAGITESDPDHPMIWVLWHNRIFGMTIAYRKYMPQRNGAVLTSASRDGAVVAEAMSRFGVEAVRGSSSRRGAAAIREMVEIIERGEDMVITPDGPRGPCYQLQPGVVKLAQVTGVPVLACLVEYKSAWRLNSWDGFFIPKPFSKVRVIFETLHTVPETGDDAAFEAERMRLEELMIGDG